MFNIIIVNNDFKKVKRITNSLLRNIEYVKISGIVSNCKELAKIFEKKNYNILVLTDIVFKKIECFSKFGQAFIVLTDGKAENDVSEENKMDKEENDEEESDENTNILYINEFLSDKEIREKVNLFIKNQNHEYIRNRIIMILRDLGFERNKKGTKCLIESILHCYINRYKYYENNLEKNVYPHVAKVFNTSAQNVKSYTIRSVNYMFTRGSSLHVAKMEEFFETDYMRKPTAKTVIRTILDQLCIEDGGREFEEEE